MNVLSKAYASIRESKGQTMAEYGLILALVAVVAAVAYNNLGTGISGLITSVVGSL